MPDFQVYVLFGRIKTMIKLVVVIKKLSGFSNNF